MISKLASAQTMVKVRPKINRALETSFVKDENPKNRNNYEKMDDYSK